MDVDAQGLAAHLLGMNTCRIGQPVVGMDNIVVQGTRHDACYNRVVIDFLVQIARITTSKLHST